MTLFDGVHFCRPFFVIDALDDDCAALVRLVHDIDVDVPECHVRRR